MSIAVAEDPGNDIRPLAKGPDTRGTKRPPSLSPRGQATAALLGLAVAAVAVVAHPFGVGALLAALVGIVLVRIAAYDIEHRIVPNRIVLPATAVVLLTRTALAPGHVLPYVLAAFVAGAAMAAPRIISQRAVGMGDVKLALLIGVTLGWGVAGAVSLAFLCMFPFALAAVVRGGSAARKTTLPFAPFLAIGTLLLLLLPGLLAR